MEVGIIGCGVVGGAVEAAFRLAGVQTHIYDKYKKINTLEEVVKKATIIFVCVPTPTEEGLQDLSPLRDVLLNLDAALCKVPIVIKCTVLPGTCDRMQLQYPLLQLVHNPEFLTEAHAAQDFMNQKAVVLGSPNPEALQASYDAYRKIFPNTPIQKYNDFKTTELGKYIHNCFLATKVAFMNEVYNYCEHINTSYANAIEVAKGQGVIGESHTKVPGPDGKFGFGGMCFPKDTEALLGSSSAATSSLTVLKAAVLSNKAQRGKNV